MSTSFFKSSLLRVNWLVLTSGMPSLMFGVRAVAIAVAVTIGVAIGLIDKVVIMLVSSLAC